MAPRAGGSSGGQRSGTGRQWSPSLEFGRGDKTRFSFSFFPFFLSFPFPPFILSFVLQTPRDALCRRWAQLTAALLARPLLAPGTTREDACSVHKWSSVAYGDPEEELGAEGVPKQSKAATKRPRGCGCAMARWPESSGGFRGADDTAPNPQGGHRPGDKTPR